MGEKAEFFICQFSFQHWLMAASKDNLQHIWIALRVDQVDPHGQEIPSGEESPALTINSLQHAETNAEWKWGGHNIFRNLL